MTEAEYEAQKQRVLDVLARWKHDLGLAAWKIDIEWYREKSGASASGWTETVMEVSSRWQYQQGMISAYLPQVAIQDDERLDWIVCHELMHVLLAEMRGDRKVTKHEERVCTQLAQAFIWVRNVAEKRGRDEVAEKPAEQPTSPANRDNGALHHLVEVV